MKLLLVSLNSKYIHTSLAAWYLKAACMNTPCRAEVLEATINDSFDAVLSSIYAKKPDIAAFTCYIWNITLVLRLVKELKKILPGLAVILGGPEVSYDSAEIMEENPGIDYIIAGEGEQSLAGLLVQLEAQKQDFDGIGGLYRRSGSGIVSEGSFAVVEDLAQLRSPYTEEMLSTTENRIVYYEASRGCPFSCSYCLSSTTCGVRYFPMQRVKEELEGIVAFGVKQVKFVDRTFNCNPARAGEIFRFILEMSEKYPFEKLPNFHFEAAADLFDGETLSVLKNMPSGLIQFEIGVQSVNAKSLEAVGRKTDIPKVVERTASLIKMGNMHIHMDLIAGLPFEDLESFRASFDRVYSLHPHMLQLGFLKLLKGSGIRAAADRYGYRFLEDPPYEVLQCDFMSYDDLTLLKGVSDVLERFHGSGRFAFCIEYLERFFPTPHELYESLLLYIEEKGLKNRALSLKDQYSLLMGFGRRFAGLEEETAINELLRLDYLSSNTSAALPEAITRKPAPGLREACFEFLRDERNLERYLPGLKELPPKEIYKHVHFENFEIKTDPVLETGGIEYGHCTVMFDHTSKLPISGRYRFFEINL